MVVLKVIRSVLSIPFRPAFHSPESNVGGQAVIEGVMMKGPSAWSVAVRGVDGRMHVKRESLKRLPSMMRWPVLRGVAALYQALTLGIKAIDFSASKAYEENGEAPLGAAAVLSTFAVAMVLGIALFVFIPLYLTRLVGGVVPVVNESPVAFNVVDGLIRVGVFLLYVSGVGLWSEMRRIYEYHGAEHKVIHAYERGGDLAVEDISRKYSTRHPRCGTSFLLIVMMVSIMVFSVIPHEWNFAMKFLSRLVLVPLVAGLSYEVLRLSARKRGNAFVDLLVRPGLLLQRLTTREPDEMQIEVALSALREVVRAEPEGPSGRAR
ncbi:MAG: DUF1385 domain-containing protein [Nitrospirae bacterium]|nr:DUF1385 domain-containing protein [Nitrospirota bacterium]